MKKNTRNIILAVVLLVVLAIIPFWPKLRQLIQPAEGPDVSCTVQVICEDLTLLPALRESGVAADEAGILFSATVSVPEGTTVLGALKQAAQTESLTVETQGAPAYVTAVGGLAAGAHGETSGWTYTINGEMVMESCDVQTVQEGDEILWTYVTSWK